LPHRINACSDGGVGEERFGFSNLALAME